MSEVLKLGITDKNNKKIIEVNSIEVLKNKGIIGDRHFNEFNDPYCQLSLIESENIDFYNYKFNLNIPYIDFRRNIITKGLRLNDLIGRRFFIGNVEVEVVCVGVVCDGVDTGVYVVAGDDTVVIVELLDILALDVLLCCGVS